MQADKIKDIVDKLNQLPYKCILFDGVWGIGKTYAVSHALKRKRNVCQISMFGLQSSQQIYHEVLCQFTLRTSSAGKISKKLNSIADKIPMPSENGEKIKEILGSIVNEKEMLLALTKRFTSPYTIVIDDLERTGENVSLEEVLGIVEELKQCSYVKVILIANTHGMEKSKKRLLEKYQEKVIERTYYITEMPGNINWGEMRIAADFITDFLQKHPVKNLRTLKKAQNFYEDVMVFCDFITNDAFLQEIRLICFAIVVESTDHLYERKPKKKGQRKEAQILERLHNNLDHRITNYLIGIKSGKGLVKQLLKYCNNQALLDKSMIGAEYQLFLRAGRKSNYYKTEGEILQLLEQWEKKIGEASNVTQLNRYIDEYVYYSDIVAKDTAKVLGIYEQKLRELLWQVASGGDEEILNRSVDVYFLSSGKIQKIYEEIQQELREKLIDGYIAHLRQTTSDQKAFEYSFKLRKDFQDGRNQKLIKQKAEQLYTRNSFPIDDMNDNKNHTCYNIMYILYHANQVRFSQYWKELECDKMAGYRIRQIVEALEKENC